MGKRHKNLKAQIFYALSTSFMGSDDGRLGGGYGASKHSDMKTGNKAGKIYSFSSFNRAKDSASIHTKSQ